MFIKFMYYIYRQFFFRSIYPANIFKWDNMVRIKSFMIDGMVRMRRNCVVLNGSLKLIVPKEKKKCLEMPVFVCMYVSACVRALWVCICVDVGVKTSSDVPSQYLKIDLVCIVASSENRESVQLSVSSSI